MKHFICKLSDAYRRVKAGCQCGVIFINTSSPEISRTEMSRFAASLVLSIHAVASCMPQNREGGILAKTLILAFSFVGPSAAWELRDGIRGCVGRSNEFTDTFGDWW